MAAVRDNPASGYEKPQLSDVRPFFWCGVCRHVVADEGVGFTGTIQNYLLEPINRRFRALYSRKQGLSTSLIDLHSFRSTEL